MDGVGEDFDEEVGVDQGPENGRVVAGKIFNLAMADLDVNLETTKKFFYKLTSGGGGSSSSNSSNSCSISNSSSSSSSSCSLFIKYLKQLSFYIMLRHPAGK